MDNNSQSETPGCSFGCLICLFYGATLISLGFAIGLDGWSATFSLIVFLVAFVFSGAITALGPKAVAKPFQHAFKEHNEAKDKAKQKEASLLAEIEADRQSRKQEYTTNGIPAIKNPGILLESNETLLFAEGMKVKKVTVSRSISRSDDLRDPEYLAENGEYGIFFITTNRIGFKGKLLTSINLSQIADFRYSRYSFTFLKANSPTQIIFYYKNPWQIAKGVDIILFLLNGNSPEGGYESDEDA